MSAGRLRHLVQLLIPVSSDDGEGGQVVTWNTAASLGPQLWADIQPVSAREQALAGALQTIASHRAALNYDSRVTVQCRFERLGPTGPTLEILGVRDVDGRQRWMEADCQEVV